MTRFQELLKKNIEEQCLNYNVAKRLYTNVFEYIRKLMRKETHKYPLLNEQLIIRVPFLGWFKTRYRNNNKKYNKYKIENE